jgi:hypothetical protein
MGMPAVAALLVVLAAQAGVWALLRARFFVGALVVYALFWCLAFPAWTAAGRRWWRLSAGPEITLCLTMLLLTAASFYVSEGMADAAYCNPIYVEAPRSCWLTVASRDAFLWIGLFGVPVALIAAALATLRTRAIRVAIDTGVVSGDGASGPKPATALVIAAIVLMLALAGFAFLIVANIGPPR